MKKVNCFLFLGLIFLTLTLISAKEYSGVGEYTLYPGDTVSLPYGYTLKYFIYEENVQYAYFGNLVTGKIATISIFNETANISYYGDSITVANVVDADNYGINTFSSGFSFIINPLEEEGNLVTLKIEEGILTACIDTDAYTIGSTTLEASEGYYGRNYYVNGTVAELKEDFSGKTETKQEDVCASGILTEYYCSDNLLKSEEKECTCKDGASCEEGSLKVFDEIKEWFGKVIGTVN